MKCQKEIKLISLDLDGTLLNSSQEVSADDRKALKISKEYGATIVVCTGRSLVGIPDCVRKIKEIDYIITSNGTSIFDVKKNKIIYKMPIDNNTSMDIISEANRLGHAVEVLIDGKWYINLNDIGKICSTIDDKSVVEFILKSRIQVDSVIEMIKKDNSLIEKININYYGDSSNKIIDNYLHSKDNIRIWSDKKHKIDVYNINATKGCSVKYLCNYLSIPLENVAAFGDDDNDYDLLEIVGLPICMKNSKGNITTISNNITLSNNESGVSYGINKYIY